MQTPSVTPAGGRSSSPLLTPATNNFSAPAREKGENEKGENRERIKWIRPSYKNVPSLKNEIDLIVQRCKESSEFSRYIFDNHMNDLSVRLEELTRFADKSVSEGRDESVVIEKQVLRLRQLRLGLMAKHTGANLSNPLDCRSQQVTLQVVVTEMSMQQTQ